MVVHNGIIENHDELRQELIKSGVQIPVRNRYRSHSPSACCSLSHQRRPLSRAPGSLTTPDWQLWLWQFLPNNSVDNLVARQGSPILLGRGADTQGRQQHLVAFDIPALLPHAQEVFAIEDGHYAVLNADKPYLRSKPSEISRPF